MRMGPIPSDRAMRKEIWIQSSHDEDAGEREACIRE